VIPLVTSTLNDILGPISLYLNGREVKRREE
jgi:hypothetical protein